MQALGLWITASIKEEEYNQKSKSESTEEEKSSAKERDASEGAEKESVNRIHSIFLQNVNFNTCTYRRNLHHFIFILQEPVQSYPGLLSLVPVMVMVGFFAILAHNGPRYSIQTGLPFHMPPGESLLWGALALQLTASFFPRILRRYGSFSASVI